VRVLCDDTGRPDLGLDFLPEEIEEDSNSFPCWQDLSDDGLQAGEGAGNDFHSFARRELGAHFDEFISIRMLLEARDYLFGDSGVATAECED
jgi:hypothetical protein